MIDHYRVLLVEDDMTAEDLRLVLVPGGRAATVPAPRSPSPSGEPAKRLPAALIAALPVDRPWITLIVHTLPGPRNALSAYFHRGGQVIAVADHEAALALPDALHPDLTVLPLPQAGTADAELDALLRARYPHSQFAHTSVLGDEHPAPSTTDSAIHTDSAIQLPATMAAANCLPALARGLRRTPNRRAPSPA